MSHSLNSLKGSYIGDYKKGVQTRLLLLCIYPPPHVSDFAKLPPTPPRLKSLRGDFKRMKGILVPCRDFSEGFSKLGFLNIWGLRI